MSRFVAWLEEGAEVPLSAATLRDRHLTMLDKLHASEGVTEVVFTLFERKRAPVSGIESRLDLQARWVVETRDGDLSYWALRHVAGRPDFHHPHAFAVRWER